jgi:aquaporin Z
MARPFAAEFIGTFALIFIGAGAGTVLGGGEMPGIAFAHGLTIMIMVAAFGDISGGYINPAVPAGLRRSASFRCIGLCHTG